MFLDPLCLILTHHLKIQQFLFLNPKQTLFSEFIAKAPIDYLFIFHHNFLIHYLYKLSINLYFYHSLKRRYGLENLNSPHRIIYSAKGDIRQVLK